MNREQKIASTLGDMVTESKTIHPTNSQRLPPSYIRFPHSASPQNPTHYPKMEEPKSNSSSPKSQKHPSSQPSRAVPVKCSQLQPFRLHTESRGQLKERAFVKRLQEINADEAKHRIRMAQGLPLTTDKPETLHKPPVKEQTKPMEIKLRTQQRAARRAGFNDLVAIKISWLEYQRQQIEKLQKMMEEEEIKILRKEMVPRAQLMPLFDRPFFPQRSTRPLTVPKEPNFKGMSNKSWRCTPSSGAHYKFQQPLNQTMKPIK